MPKANRVCLETYEVVIGHRRGRCRPCRAAYSRRHRRTEKGIVTERTWNNRVAGTNMAKAKTRVYLAVRTGRLPKASTQKCPCGAQASVYDHRDYLKPTEVTAVCRPCNKKLGKGLNGFT